MLSVKTSLEIVNVIDGYTEKIIDRIFFTFDIEHLIHPSNGKISRDGKINLLIKTVKNPPPIGPFSDDFNMDLLQYMVEHFYRHENDNHVTYDRSFGSIWHEDKFAYKHQTLANSLKRDGYSIKETVIKKLLPSEIQEAKTESEVFTLLKHFNFFTTKGHLDQAIQNHAQGNWAGANAQFRPFIESLLISITKIILPHNTCESASKAITLLSKTANPPFLRSDLNEVENPKCTKPFIEGFWKRLHPEGAHPGLSDEEDSSFRYHISIVVAYYLLNRLLKRS